MDSENLPAIFIEANLRAKPHTVREITLYLLNEYGSDILDQIACELGNPESEICIQIAKLVQEMIERGSHRNVLVTPDRMTLIGAQLTQEHRMLRANKERW